MTQVIQIPYTPRDIQRKLHDKLSTHRFGVIVAHRRLGKTILCINQLIKSAALCTKPRPRFAYVAPLYSQAKNIAWDYLKHYTKPIPGVKRNESELWVEVPSSSGDPARIRLYGSDNPDSIRGIYMDGCVIDEVAQCKPNLWGSIIRPMLVDREGWCVFIGTPATLDHFYNLYLYALREDNHWFAELIPYTATDILPQDEIDDARRTMSESEFRREFLCDFTASLESNLIPVDLVLEAKNRENLPNTWDWAPVVLGVDVARFGDDESVICIRQGCHLRGMITYRNLDLMTLSDRVANVIHEYRASAVFVDTVGIGAGVADRLRSLGYSNIIDVNVGYTATNPKYKNKRAEIWGAIKQWLIEGGDLLDDDVLISQLSSVQYSYDLTDRIVLEKKEDMKKRGLPSPDRGDALALTFAMPVHEEAFEELDYHYYIPPRGADRLTGY